MKNLLFCGKCGFPMKTTWARGNGGDYYYYYCICGKKYIRADLIEKRIIALVRKYAASACANIDDFKIKITGGSFGKIKLAELSRRLSVTETKFQRNILEKIIKMGKFNLFFSGIVNLAKILYVFWSSLYLCLTKFFARNFCTIFIPGFFLEKFQIYNGEDSHGI
ncbi:MAG: zinc ribbon domain-containing protein [Elusimicrobiota bacterium]